MRYRDTINLPVNYNALHWAQRKRVREMYVKLQKGKCCHCGASLDKNPCPSVRSLKIDKSLFPTEFFKYSIHLHHNHDTCMTIGAVHSYCNAVLWQYEGK